MLSPSGRITPTARPVIVWFRDDLRLADNPALHCASASGQSVICVYIMDEESAHVRALGAAARWWLHHSLMQLWASLQSAGAQLVILKGAAEAQLVAFSAACQASDVYWNRRYGEAERTLDGSIKERLKLAGLKVQSFNGNLLNEPWDVQTKAGTPMKVFTPYWRAARERGEPAAPLPAPLAISSAIVPDGYGVTLESLELLPTKPDWSGEMQQVWKPGEQGARNNLTAFLAGAIKNYGENRNRPDRSSTSRLSPHLRFGEISPRQIWHSTRGAFASGTTPALEYDGDKFLSEIGWREFSYHLLYHFPKLASANFQPKFDAFPWSDNDKTLQAWQRGMTGYPIIDAGMRELWRTGWMHNRVRMVVGSFLVKHLLLDWRKGEDWFWDTLVDADPASNSASWQWIAGSGADAAPYFRIFAPVLQGEKFDPDGAYVRKYVPELAKLPNKYLHAPWKAPHLELARAGITLGLTYPHPVVVHEEARVRALAAFKSISANAA